MALINIFPETVCPWLITLFSIVLNSTPSVSEKHLSFLCVLFFHKRKHVSFSETQVVNNIYCHQTPSLTLVQGSELPNWSWNKSSPKVEEQNWKSIQKIDDFPYTKMHHKIHQYNNIESNHIENTTRLINSDHWNIMCSKFCIPNCKIMHVRVFNLIKLTSNCGDPVAGFKRSGLKVSVGCCELKC